MSPKFRIFLNFCDVQEKCVKKRKTTKYKTQISSLSTAGNKRKQYL